MLFLTKMKYPRKIVLLKINLFIISIFFNFDEDSPFRRNNMILFCCFYNSHDAVLLIFISSIENDLRISLPQQKPNRSSLLCNNEDMLKRIRNLPKQKTMDDPLIDQFFNGSSFTWKVKYEKIHNLESTLLIYFNAHTCIVLQLKIIRKPKSNIILFTLLFVFYFLKFITCQFVNISIFSICLFIKKFTL
jgi:hypothetical protein